MANSNLRSKCVVIGGNPRWIKAMEPILPGAKFVSPEQKPNQNFIKDADMVWIQTRCIGHSYSRAYRDFAKSKNIPVHYFDYSSAVECAKEIYRADLKMSAQLRRAS